MHGKLGAESCADYTWRAAGGLEGSRGPNINSAQCTDTESRTVVPRSGLHFVRLLHRPFWSVGKGRTRPDMVSGAGIAARGLDGKWRPPTEIRSKRCRHRYLPKVSSVASWVGQPVQRGPGESRGPRGPGIRRSPLRRAHFVVEGVDLALGIIQISRRPLRLDGTAVSLIGVRPIGNSLLVPVQEARRHY